MSKSDLEDLVKEQMAGARMGRPLELHKEVDRHDIALSESIKQNLDISELDGQHQNQLCSVEQQLIKAELEIKNSLEKSGFKEHILIAIQTVMDDGKTYLTVEEYESVKSNFNEAKSLLEKRDLKEPLKESFAQILGFSPSTVHSILKVGIAKCQEGNYRVSLSVFIVLTILQPHDFDLWYRTAIVAQQCEDVDLALRAYAEVIKLNEGLVEAYLFSAECYLMKGLHVEAKALCEKAEKQIEAADSPTDEVKQLLEDVKSMFG